MCEVCKPACSIGQRAHVPAATSPCLLLLRVAGKAAAAPRTGKGRSEGCSAGGRQPGRPVPPALVWLWEGLRRERHLTSKSPPALPAARRQALAPGPWLCFWLSSSCPPPALGQEGVRGVPPPRFPVQGAVENSPWDQSSCQDLHKREKASHHRNAGAEWRKCLRAVRSASSAPCAGLHASSAPRAVACWQAFSSGLPLIGSVRALPQGRHPRVADFKLLTWHLHTGAGQGETCSDYMSASQPHAPAAQVTP